MKVSILMPTYNDESLIAETINTVIAQTYSNWELLIMDDGSNDNTSSVVNVFTDSRIRLFRQENKGQLVALNNLCPYITGDIVLMLHSDDRLYQNDSLEKNVQYFSDPSIDGVYSSMVQFFSSGKPDEIIKAPQKIGSKTVKKLMVMLGSNVILDPFFIRRDKFESHVKVNYLRWYIPYWLNFTNEKVTSLKLKYSDYPWYYYRIYDQNYANSIIGNFEAYFTRFRAIFFLSKYFSVPFPLIQKEICRRFNIYGFVLGIKSSKKNIARCMKANLRSMKQRTPKAYTLYFEQLISFYQSSSDRTLKLESPIVNAYLASESRKFYNDLQKNTVNDVHKEIIDNLPLGFKAIEVKNLQEKLILEEVLKFMCILAPIYTKG